MTLIINPDEPFRGIRALFNGDMHLIEPNYAPREDWRILDATSIQRVADGTVFFVNSSPAIEILHIEQVPR